MESDNVIGLHLNNEQRNSRANIQGQTMNSQGDNTFMDHLQTPKILRRSSEKPPAPKSTGLVIKARGRSQFNNDTLSNSNTKSHGRD